MSLLSSFQACDSPEKATVENMSDSHSVINFKQGSAFTVTYFSVQFPVQKEYSE